MKFVIERYFCFIDFVKMFVTFLSLFSCKIGLHFLPYDKISRRLFPLEKYLCIELNFGIISKVIIQIYIHSCGLMITRLMCRINLSS